MRTKNLNLKKKIAFIASVAMIATTAAYLPAEVTQNIFNSSITVEAALVDDAIDYFDVYVKIANKYLAKSGKTYNTLDAAEKANDVLVKITKRAADATVAGIEGTTDAVFAVAGDTTKNTSNATVAENADNKIMLPANTPVNAEISVEVVTKKTSTEDFNAENLVILNDVKTYSVTLNDKGTAEFKKDAKVSVFDGSKATKNAGTGDYEKYIETVNFKNLKFAVSLNSFANPVSQTPGDNTFKIGNETAQNLTGFGAKKIKKVNFSGSEVYATLLPITGVKADGASKAVTPGQSVRLTFTTVGTWEPSVKNPTFSFNEEGVATSDVVKFTGPSGAAEYYVFEFTKAAEAIETSNNLNLNTAITYAAGTSKTDVLGSRGNYRTEVKTEKTSTGEYITVFYVYTNDTTTKKYYLTNNNATDTAYSLVDAANNEYTIAKETGATSSTKDVQIDIDDNGTGETPVLYYAATSNTEIQDANSQSYSPKHYQVTSAKPFKVVVDTNYKVPVDYDDENNTVKAAPTTKADRKAFLEECEAEAVVKGQTVTRPEDPTKPGYTFDGWYIGEIDSTNGVQIPSASPKKVYGATGTAQSTKDDNINPNMILVAQWKANEYTLTVDANGGSFADSIGGTTYSGTAKYEVTDRDSLTDKPTKVAIKTDADIEEANTASVKGKSAARFAKPSRDGYTFLGWAAKADAKEADLLTDEAYEKMQPTTTGAAITVYAVWEATKYPVEFKEIDDKYALDEAAAYSATDANVNVSGIQIATDGTIENLPTPTKKGYVFAGWYRKVVDEDDNSKINGVLVNSSSVIPYKALDGVTSGSAASKLTLYAKFNKDSYKITYDLGDGKWANENDAEQSPKAFDMSTATLDVATPKLGTGEYYDFTGWQINGDTKKYTDNKALLTQLQKVAGDVTLTATYAVKPGVKTKGYINLELNEGSYWNVKKVDGKDDTYYKYDVSTNNNAANKQVLIGGDSGSALTEKINGANITESNGTTGLNYFVVARPGYNFTGWFSDKECTKPYTFGSYPEGTEINVYAGWEADTNTRYRLLYSLVDEDKALINLDTEDRNNANEPTVGSRTYMGTTGTDVTAKDKKITYKGVTYVYDSVLSEKMSHTKTLEAKFIPRNSDATAGTLEVDSNQYTTIKAVFSPEGKQSSAELGKATNVKVSDKGAVTFTAADNAVKYQVCKIVDGKKYYSAKTDATTINITPAKKDYQVYVIAFDENGKSTHSATVKVTVKAALGTVKNPKVTESLEGDKKIGTVTWDAVEGATWYKVFKVINGKTYWGSKVTENKYVFKNLPKDSSYIIYVAAGDDKGNVTYGARTKISKYPAVQNVKISADKKTVTFDKAEGAVNYQVAKLINGKTYYGTKSESNSITLQSAAKSGTQIFVLAFFTGDDGKTYSSYSQSITVE